MGEQERVCTGGGKIVLKPDLPVCQTKVGHTVGQYIWLCCPAWTCSMRERVSHRAKVFSWATKYG